MTLFNVLTTNAVDLQRMLALGQITSVQIVKEYISQIDGYETELNALISQAPRDKVLRAAARLDDERKNGQVRSPLHGIPIVLKVVSTLFPHKLNFRLIFFISRTVLLQPPNLA
jgi:amidase